MLRDVIYLENKDVVRIGNKSIFYFLFENIFRASNSHVNSDNLFKYYDISFSNKEGPILIDKSSEFYGFGTYCTIRTLPNIITNFFIEKEGESSKTLRKYRFKVNKDTDKQSNHDKKLSNINGQHVQDAVRLYNSDQKFIDIKKRYFAILTIFAFNTSISLESTIEEIIEKLVELFKISKKEKLINLVSTNRNEQTTYFIASYTNSGLDIRHFIVTLNIAGGNIKARITKTKSEFIEYEGEFFATRGHQTAYFESENKKNRDFLSIMIPKANLNNTQEFLLGIISYIDVDCVGICSRIVLLKTEELLIDNIIVNSDLKSLMESKYGEIMKIIKKYILFDKIETQSRKYYKIPEKLESLIKAEKSNITNIKGNYIAYQKAILKIIPFQVQIDEVGNVVTKRIIISKSSRRTTARENQGKVVYSGKTRLVINMSLQDSHTNNHELVTSYYQIALQINSRIQSTSDFYDKNFLLGIYSGLGYREGITGGRVIFIRSKNNVQERELFPRLIDSKEGEILIKSINDRVGEENFFQSFFRGNDDIFIEGDYIV